MSWIDRLAGCAVGALVIGLLAALVGVGPERVLTALLALAAATLGGALLDDLVGSRTKSAWATRSGGVPTQPVGQQPYTAPRGRTPARGENLQRGAALPEPPMPQRRLPITAPEAHWVDARLPAKDLPSSRWVAAGERDLIATYLSASTAPDTVCTRCGRTIARPEGDVPSDCPIGERVSCPLRRRDIRLVTGFQSLRDVSRHEPGDHN